MNNSALCNNHKVNKKQTANGDVTIIERIDMVNDKNVTRELMEVAFRPQHDYGMDWQCALRQGEHDIEHDGVITLKDPKALEGAKTSNNTQRGGDDLLQ